MVHILYSTILDEILISPSENCYLVMMEGLSAIMTLGAVLSGAVCPW